MSTGEKTMSTKKKSEAEPKSKGSISSQDACAIVLGRLGTPENFSSCSATNVFGKFWRVNVRVFKYANQETMIKPQLISDSFLIKIENNRITSGDSIENKYKIQNSQENTKK